MRTETHPRIGGSVSSPLSGFHCKFLCKTDVLLRIFTFILWLWNFYFEDSHGVHSRSIRISWVSFTFELKFEDDDDDDDEEEEEEEQEEEKDDDDDDDEEEEEEELTVRPPGLAKKQVGEQ